MKPDSMCKGSNDLFYELIKCRGSSWNCPYKGRKSIPPLKTISKIWIIYRMLLRILLHQRVPGLLR